MNRRSLVAPLVLLLLSCDRTPTVQFRAICAPADAKCSFKETCDAQFIGEVRLDLDNVPSFDENLWLAVETHNQAKSGADASSGRVNTSDAFMQEVRIEYDGIPLPGTTTLIQQAVPADGTGVLGFNVVDAAGVAALRLALPTGDAMVVARLKGKGVYGDGTAFETPEYKVPFRTGHNLAGGCVGSGGVPEPTCPHTGQLPAGCGQ